MKFKLTRGERPWVLYDAGNSVLALLIATILPIYFHYLAEDLSGVSPVDSLAYWGYASAAATLFVVLLGKSSPRVIKNSLQFLASKTPVNPFSKAFTGVSFWYA